MDLVEETIVYSSSCCPVNGIGSCSSFCAINSCCEKRNQEDQDVSESVSESVSKRSTPEEFIEAPTVVTKRCNTCEQMVDVKQFHRDKSKNDGLQSSCKSCRKTTRRKRHRQEPTETKLINLVEETANSFGSASCGMDGDSSRSSWRKRNHDDQDGSESVSKRSKPEEFIEGPPVVTKRCCTCEEILEVSHFPRHKSAKNGLRGSCKSCRKIARRRHGQERTETSETNEATETHVTVQTTATTESTEAPEATETTVPVETTEATETAETKRCNRCKQYLVVQLFGKNKRNKDGHQSACMSCRRKSSALENGQKSAHYNNLRKQAGSCAKCHRTNNIGHLQFAHYSRKDKRRTKNGNRRAFANCSIKQMNHDLEFGRFLCIRCHCIETEAENKAKLSTSQSARALQKAQKIRTDFVNNVKLEIGCCQRSGCGKIVGEPFSYWHFDHLPQYVKLDGICELVLRHKSLKVIGDEIKKCQLLCADCHTIVTAERRAEKKNPLPK